MIFTSVEFVLFLGVVTGLYFVLPARFRWMILLAGSIVFYYSLATAFLVLCASIILNYAGAIAIDRLAGSRRKALFILLVLANVSLLASLKYLGFFSANASLIAGMIGWNYSPAMLSLLLPIGISFFTFQNISYIIEVYKKRFAPERNPGVFALYVIFFPKIAAGPIERPQHLIHQLKEQHTLDYARAGRGAEMILWGLFKKVVVADQLATIVNAVYNSPASFTGSPLIIATVLFAFQIYFDFAGYTDIALGAAKIFGINLTQNFNLPYFSKNVQDFWRRWHISLSTWLRDYLYIPLGGNRVSVPRWYLNFLVVFVLCGLWHGSSWNFVIWGALHGVFIVATLMATGVLAKISQLTGLDKAPRIKSSVKIIATFIAIDFSWIFFRANTLEDAVYVITNMFSASNLPALIDKLPWGMFSIYYAIAMIAALEIYELIRYARPGMLGKVPGWARWMACLACIALIVVVAIFSSGATFIYSRF